MDNERLAQVMQRAEALCRERGVRLTPQRRTVLELVCEAERPMSAYDILDLMRATISNPAPPTVYRALDFLLEQGLVHKLESIHAFIGCSNPDHPHSGQLLICADCGDVNELEDPAIARSLRLAESASGFAPKRRVVELIGTCARCTGKDHE